MCAWRPSLVYSRGVFRTPPPQCPGWELSQSARSVWTARQRPWISRLQREFFEQLAIARETGLPAVLHCRGAFNELIQSVRRIGGLPAGGVIHSFSGSPELAEELSSLGLSFSMGGTLTFRNSARRAAVLKKIYPDRFLLETDSPDIPPVQKHGEINRPRNILYNLEAAAEIIGDTAENIAGNTTRNAARLFGLIV